MLASTRDREKNLHEFFTAATGVGLRECPLSDRGDITVEVRTVLVANNFQKIPVETTFFHALVASPKPDDDPPHIKHDVPLRSSDFLVRLTSGETRYDQRKMIVSLKKQLPVNTSSSFERHYEVHTS